MARRGGHEVSGGVQLKEKTERRRSDPLDERHLDDYIREKNGEVVSRKSGGDPHDHITEVEQERRGLENDIEKLEKISNITINMDIKMPIESYKMHAADYIT